MTVRSLPTSEWTPNSCTAHLHESRLSWQAGRSGPAAGALLQALHVVGPFPILDSVGVVTETREPPVPGPERFQVTQVGALSCAGSLTGHEHGNAGRIRHDTGGEHPFRQLLERH